MRTHLCATLSLLGSVSYLFGTPSGPPSQDWPSLVAAGWFVVSLAFSAWPFRSLLADWRRYLFGWSVVAAPVALAANYLAISTGTFSVSYLLRGSLVVALLLLTWRGNSMSASPGRVGSLTSLRGGATGLGVIAVGCAVLFAVHEARTSLWLAHQQRVSIPRKAQAGVEVVVFTDFLCPACRTAHSNYGPILRELTEGPKGQVMVTVFDYPLDSSCNAASPSSPHPLACDAAVAVRLAAKSGQQEAAADFFYKNLESLTRDQFSAYLKEKGLEEAWRTERESLIASIRDDVNVARSLGITGVPAYFVNGLPVANWTASDLRTVIRRELGKGWF